VAENTKIEWTDKTFNPWIGCTKVSPECTNCYAEKLAQFRRWAEWGKSKPRHLTKTWGEPLKWNREAERSNVRYKVFCASLADVFDTEVEPRWRSDLFDLIEQTPRLDWQLLTKRPENMPQMLPREWQINPLPNVWLGASVGHPETKWRIGDLVNVPAAVHFLSCEPLLADLGKVELYDIEWVICGGESGDGARAMHPAWARSMRDQCLAGGVPFFFKQWGEWAPRTFGEVIELPPPDGSSRLGCFTQGKFVVGMSGSDLQNMARVGKKAAGRHLDGRVWDCLPKGASHVAS
jgi:protein gp37